MGTGALVGSDTHLGGLSTGARSTTSWALLRQRWRPPDIQEEQRRSTVDGAQYNHQSYAILSKARLVVRPHRNSTAQTRRCQSVLLRPTIQSPRTLLTLRTFIACDVLSCTVVLIAMECTGVIWIADQHATCTSARTSGFFERPRLINTKEPNHDQRC